MQSISYACQILMILELSLQIVEKTKKNFMKILPVGASCSMRTKRRTYSHDEANSHFSQFFERA